MYYSKWKCDGDDGDDMMMMMMTTCITQFTMYYQFHAIYVTMGGLFAGLRPLVLMFISLESSSLKVSIILCSISEAFVMLVLE